MSTATPRLHVRASQILRKKKIWIAPILLAAVFTGVMATVYERAWLASAVIGVMAVIALAAAVVLGLRGDTEVMQEGRGVLSSSQVCGGFEGEPSLNFLLALAGITIPH